MLLCFKAFLYSSRMLAQSTSAMVLRTRAFCPAEARPVGYLVLCPDQKGEVRLV